MIAAGLSGLAAATFQLGRLDRLAALSEMRELLAKLDERQRQAALDRAAAGFVDPHQTDTWHRSALELLVEAGADVDAARAIREGQGRRHGLQVRER